MLEHMCTKLEELADETDMKGFDVEYNVCMYMDDSSRKGLLKKGINVK